MAIALIAGLSSVASALVLELGVSLWAAFAVGAGLSLVSRALMPKPDIGTQMGGQSVTTREAAHSRKIVYGRARIGGNIVYLESTGSDNKYLWLVIAVAGHEIDAYESVWFNDEKIYNGTNFLNNWASVVNISFYKGDQETADSALVSASNSKWTADHKLLDTAYMVLRLEHDPEKFSSGLPNISTIIRGKKVLDPSDNSTAWSQNPALCIYDYLRDTKYGLSETVANILTSSVTTAKGVCDEAITLSAGGTQPRYTIDGVVDTSNSIKANIETMIGSMAGRLVYSGGKFEVHAGEYIAPSITVDESQVIGEITVQTKQSRRNAFNGVKGVFLSEEDNYILADYPAQISSAYAVQDGDPIYLDMALPYTSNNIRAQRLAKLALFRSRQQEAITIPCNLSALRFKIGDNISVTNTRLGYSGKVFEVVGYAMDFTSDGQIVVNVDAIETASSIWDWQASDEEVFLGAGEVELYNGSVAVAPTSISVTSDSFLSDDGTFNSQFNVAWTDADDAFTDHYVVEWKLASSSNYFSQQTKSSPFNIVNLNSDQTYNVRVKAVNELGVSSTYISSSPTAAIDTTAPSVPTSVSATGQYQQINVNWVNPTQNDFSHVDVYRATSSGGTYSLRGKSAGTSFGDTDLAVTAQFFYKVKAVDYTGNASAFSGVVNATTTAEPIDSLVTTTRISSSVNTNAPTNTVFAAIVGRNPIDGDIVLVTYTGATPNTQVAYQRINGAWVAQSNIISGDVITPESVDTGQIADGAVTGSKIPSQAITNAKIAIDAIQGAVIAAGAIVEAKLGVDAVTSAKIADNAVLTAAIAANAVTTVNIANDAITTALIAENAVTSAVIAAGAITSTELGVDAVTSAKIADNAVTAAQIGADAVTTAKIANDAVTNALIATDAVNGDSIAANSVTASSIVAGTITASELAADSVTASQIAAGSVTASEIAANTITASQIAADAITANEIAADAVTANAIAANTITAAEIAANTVTASQIAADAITADEIAANAVTASAIAANTITASEIAADAIGANEIAANAITSDAIAANAITANEIAADAVTANAIQANAVTANEIAANAVTANEIAADAVTANAIAANAVTADAIAANSVTANAIAANTITASEIAANAVTANAIDVANLAAINADMGTITAGSISSALITGDVTEVYPIGQYYYTALTSSAATLGSFTIPAPTSGILKRQKIDVNVLFRIRNSAQTPIAQAAIVFTVEKKSKGVNAVSVGTVTVESESISYNQLLSLSGNVLDSLDVSGGVAASADASGSNEPAYIQAVFYDSGANKTYVQCSAYTDLFSTGNTLYFSDSKFTSAGTWVTPTTTETIYVATPPDPSAGVGNLSVYLPFKMSYGQTTSLTDYRVRAHVSNAQSGVTYTANRMVGTLENIS